MSDVGKQPKRIDTWWNAQPQVTTNMSGEPKGLCTILEERGIDTAKMLKGDMKKVLKEMHDFKTQKTKIEELIAKHGHRVSEIPL